MCFRYARILILFMTEMRQSHGKWIKGRCSNTRVIQGVISSNTGRQLKTTRRIGANTLNTFSIARKHLFDVFLSVLHRIQINDLLSNRKHVFGLYLGINVFALESRLNMGRSGLNINNSTLRKPTSQENHTLICRHQQSPLQCECCQCFVRVCLELTGTSAVVYYLKYLRVFSNSRLATLWT